MQNKKGFTLIEILVVVAVIGVLAALGIPGYIGMQARSARTESYTNLESLRLLEEQFFAERGQYAPPTPGPNNCTPWIFYNASTGLPNSLEDSLPAFQPGGCVGAGCNPPYGLEFDYAIQSCDTDGDGSADQFTARARGTNGRIPNTEIYTVDWLNNKNY